MENFQYSTEDELFIHKKRLLENTKLKTHSIILTISTAMCLFILLIISLLTIRNVWECKIDQNNKNQSHICKELRKAVNCKTTVAPPIKAEVLLRIK